MPNTPRFRSRLAFGFAVALLLSIGAYLTWLAPGARRSPADALAEHPEAQRAPSPLPFVPESESAVSRTERRQEAQREEHAANASPTADEFRVQVVDADGQPLRGITVS